jgi:multiple sugar transport system substrate-binding protein
MLFVFLLIATSAACGGETPNGSTANQSAMSPQKPVETPKSIEPVELVVSDGLGDFPEERFNKVIAEPVKKKFPNITLKWASNKEIKTRVTAGEPLDIVMSSSGLMQARVLDFNLQSDIAPLIKKYNFDLSKVEPTALDMFKNGNAVWAIPSFMSPSPLYYNKDIFDKFGVAYPKDGMTWDDVYELAKKVTRKDGDQQYYGLFLSFAHVTRRNQYSLNVIDPKTETAAFNTDSWKKVYEAAAQFYLIPGMNMTSKTAALAYQRDSFTKDRTVAMWLPVSTLHTEAELKGMNWDLATFPVYKDKPGVGPQPYPVGFFVTTSSKHKDEAFQAAAYMASEQYQLPWIKQGEFLTALKSDTLRSAFGQDTDMYKGKNTKAMLPAKYAPASAITKYNGDAEGQMNTAFTKVILNQKDLNTALREAEEATNKKIAEKRATGNK